MSLCFVSKTDFPGPLDTNRHRIVLRECVGIGIAPAKRRAAIGIGTHFNRMLSFWTEDAVLRTGALSRRDRRGHGL
jgi:hypothetical protein